MSSALAGRARLTAGAALAALVGLTGCGEGGPKIVPVSGIVLIDGQPLTYGHS
jgi:predicted small lipoprotein YifL